VTYRQILGICISILAWLPGLLFAMPRVNGTIISMPDDGWYQVQRVPEYTTVCEGVYSCMVPPGEYSVINHDKGLRWDNIHVHQETYGRQAPEVNGNRISWPDNGWYQVLSVVDYRSLCEGDLWCDVPAGTYIVINHNKGDRWEAVEVFGDGHTGHQLSIEGNLIRWPADGWYQVQDALTYATLCEGTTGCEVANGRYNVINHTTGQRWENLEVGSGPSTTDIINTQNYDDLVAFALRSFAGGNFRDGILMAKRFLLQVEPDSTTPTGDYEGDGFNALREYSCTNGGTARAEYLQTGSRSFNVNALFDNCQWHDTVLNGNALFSHFDRKFYRSWSGTIDFSGFSIDYADGSSLEFNGHVQDSTEENPGGGDTRVWINRLESLTYTGSAGEQQTISDSNTRYHFCVRCRSGLPYAGLSGEQTVYLPALADGALQVSTPLPFENNVDGMPPFSTGRLQISAAEGSQVFIDAASETAYSLDVTVSSPTTRTNLVVPWSQWLDNLDFIEYTP